MFQKIIRVWRLASVVYFLVSETNQASQHYSLIRLGTSVINYLDLIFIVIDVSKFLNKWSLNFFYPKNSNSIHVINVDRGIFTSMILPFYHEFWKVGPQHNIAIYCRLHRSVYSVVSVTFLLAIPSNTWLNLEIRAQEILLFNSAIA